MSKAPDKIYLNSKHPEPYWFKEKQLETDTEYIRKDALLEWLEEQKKLMTEEIGYRLHIDDIIDKINSL